MSRIHTLILVNERHYISTVLNRLKTLALPLTVALLMIMNVVVLTKFDNTSQELVEQRAVIVETKHELRGTLEAVESLSKEKTTIESSLKEERLKSDEIKAENESLKVSLQAKKEAEAKAEAEKVRLASIQKEQEAVTVAPVVKSGGGSCESWMAQAGIPLTNATHKLILNESGCNPTVWNKQGSGAYGIPQALPRTKLLDPAQCGGPDGYTNPVTQLRWMKCYVEGRYGTWENALNMWYSRCDTKEGCWY